MDLPNPFKLAKLTIESFSRPSRRPDSQLRKLQVQFNPETLTLGHESVFESEQTIGAAPSKGQWVHSPPKSLHLALLFDGTGVADLGQGEGGNLPTVAERVQEFLEVCYRVSGEIHEPPYLRLTWDKGVLGTGFDCRLQFVNVTYTLFDRDGSPRRAKLDAAFIENLDATRQAAKDRLSSPDLTHRRRVQSGDTLPLLCREIYGSAAYYLAVAEANGLDDFRALDPGRELIFPPFERVEEA